MKSQSFLHKAEEVQPFPVREIIQSTNHLCCPRQDVLQELRVSLVPEEARTGCNVPDVASVGLSKGWDHVPQLNLT